jgi:putative pyruvate formate lyase activating enzyme
VCKVNRLKNERGFCSIGQLARVSSFNPHFGEEAPLVGWRGSGTIFFAGCSLKCVFCQNYEISHLIEGSEVTSHQLAQIMLTIQGWGCHNINFVTPTHVIPQIIEGVCEAREKGLKIPLVYNSGGYDRVEILKLLDGIIDIYMPDFKFTHPELAKKFLKAENYPEIAQAALKEMHRQVGDLIIDAQGIAKRGLLVRHLVMPYNGGGIEKVVSFIANELSQNTYLNIMNQYRPCGDAFKFKELSRAISEEEFAFALHQAERHGLTRLDR